MPGRAEAPSWPPDVPLPGERGWLEAALRWLWEAVPATRWMHESAAGAPWVLTVASIMAVRHEIEGLREEYRRAGSGYGGQLPPAAVAALKAAAVAEAERRTVVLNEAIGLEPATFALILRRG